MCARVYARQGEGAVSRGRRWGGAPLTLSCRHAQANVDAASNDGRTALMRSAYNGHDACLRQLLAAKVRVRSMRARAGRSAARCLEVRVRVLGASARGEDRAHSSVAREMRSCAEVCVCACQGEGAVSRGRRWGDAPLTLVLRGRSANTCQPISQQRE